MIPHRTITTLLAAAMGTGLLLAPAASAHPPAHKPAYPVTAAQPVSDRYHGDVVVDEYRWLEDGGSPAVKQWTDEQNALSRRFLDALPARQAIKSRLTALLSPTRQDAPIHRGNRYFFRRQDGSTPQSVLMVQDGPTGEPRPLVDPNPLAKDGTVSLDWWEASPKGDYVAYGLSEGGDEQSVLHVVEVATGRKLDEKIPGCRYASLAWTPDQRGFFYTRFPGKGATGQDKQKAFHHVLGRAAADDELVFEHPGGVEMIMWVQLDAPGRHLVIGVNKGSSSTNELYHRDLTDPAGTLRPIVSGFTAQFYGDIHQNTLYLRTNEKAPRGKIMAVDLTRPARKHWRTVVAESRDAMQGAFVAGGQLVVEYLHDATSQVRIHDLNGHLRRTMPLPGLGTVSNLVGFAEDHDLFFSFTSYLQPTSVYRYDVKRATLATFFAPKLPIRPQDLVQRQVWYRSKDGTRVPMFLVHRRGLRLDGLNPTMLTGYGGFDISITPHFSANDYVWVERGGVLAVPNLRGGGEFGRAWHEAGTRERKQNVFDDFTAAAEWLVANGYTSPGHLGIEGGSNGGLLVGAALTQRPELFKAVVCAVPLLDMLRYHQFLIARYWVPEYGSSEDPKQYRYLKAYSPYHHVVPGRHYPATLIMTGESDTRVDPLHARKMAARLQQATAGAAPILLQIERRAGHGAGKPMTKRVEDGADVLGFLSWQLAR